MPKTVLITGASDGLGLALARHYASRSARLALVGRRPLAALDDPILSPETYCQADLSDPDAPAQVRAWLQAQRFPALDLVIHNAAIGWYGAPHEQPQSDLEALLAVNVFAPIALTHALLPRITAPGGKIAVISSLAAGLPAPRYAAYAASKAALEAWCRNVRVELRPQIRVQVVRLGAVRTSMHAKSGFPHLKRAERFPLAAAVAPQVAAALESNRPVTTLGALNRKLWRAGRLLAAPLERWYRR